MVDENVQQLIDALAEMRAVIREAHGVQKDLERTIKEAKALKGAKLNAEVENRINTVITEGARQIAISMKQTTDEATERVNRRFDLLAGILMGEDARTKREGKPSLLELAEEYVRQNGPIQRCIGE